MPKKAQIVDDVPDVVKPEPLTLDQLDNFYVETDRVRDKDFPSTKDALIRKIRTDERLKLLFAGHRGSGKSTELVNIIKTLGNDYRVVRFSILDELDPHNFDYVDIIFVTMERLFKALKEEASNQRKKIGDKLLGNIKTWLSDTTEIKLEETAYSVEAAAGIKGKGSLLEIVTGIFAEIKANISKAGKSQTEIRTKITQRLSQLTAYCNLLINEFTKYRPLLVIIEDLDKPDITLVRDTFYNHSRAFTDLNTRIIFTVNSFIINSPEAGLLQGQIDTHILPMIKINNKDGTSCREGRDLLEKILDRRLEGGLIEEGALQEAIEKSGGVLRDFFEIIEIAATSARHNRLPRIGKEQIRYACAKVKSDYNRKIKGNDEEPGRISTAQLYEKLLTIAQSDRKVFAQDDTMAILLGSQAVLEYNGDQWFDIHPLVRELLKDMGKLC